MYAPLVVEYPLSEPNKLRHRQERYIVFVAAAKLFPSIRPRNTGLSGLLRNTNAANNAHRNEREKAKINRKMEADTPQRTSIEQSKKRSPQKTPAIQGITRRI